MKIKPQKSKIKNVILFSLIAALILPSFSFGQTSETPKDWQEVKSLGEKILEVLPQGLSKAWQEALEIWKKMTNWFLTNIWSWLKGKIQSFWQNINLKEEFQKELKEMRNDIFRIEKIIWQKLIGWLKK